jgi:branched-chain amino acid transport system ATP-binding protein
MLEVQHLTKRFGGVAAMTDVSLQFPPGTLTAIIGPNGAGKSTFFNLMSGAIVPDSGKVIFNGEDITGLSRAAIVRRGIGRAFQVASFFPTMTVAENLMAAIAAHRGQWGDFGRSFPRPGVRSRALEVADLLGLADEADTLSSSLSHGDQKLLDIGLALAMDPKMLLLDEPTARMGPDERWRMIDKVHGLWRQQGLTFLFIEHDMDIVFKIAQTIHVLKYGAVLAQGTPDEIRCNPLVIDAYLGADHEAAIAAGEA